MKVIMELIVELMSNRDTSKPNKSIQQMKYDMRYWVRKREDRVYEIWEIYRVNKCDWLIKWKQDWHYILTDIETETKTFIFRM